MAQHRYRERLLNFADYASLSSHLFPPIIDVNGGTDCLLLPDVVGCDGIWISDKLGAEKRANHPSDLVGLC